MTIPEFIERLKPLARPRYDWIVLGDGSICVRDRVNADPINVLASHIDSSYTQANWAEDSAETQAQKILGLTFNRFLIVANAVVGECSLRSVTRAMILDALGMEPETSEHVYPGIVP